MLNNKEQLDLTLYVLENLVEMLKDSNSADRDSDPERADRQIELATQVIGDIKKARDSLRQSNSAVQESDLGTDPDVQKATQKAKAPAGASATFLRRDQCSFGRDATDQQLAAYQELLAEVHKVGDILMSLPRGTYANLGRQMVWVSPLTSEPGADLFIYGPGGNPEADGNGTYPVSYFDELGVFTEVPEVTARLKAWLEKPTFGQMQPDYYLDQVASLADMNRYSEFETNKQASSEQPRS